MRCNFKTDTWSGLRGYRFQQFLVSQILSVVICFLTPIIFPLIPAGPHPVKFPKPLVSVEPFILQHFCWIFSPGILSSCNIATSLRRCTTLVDKWHFVINNFHCNMCMRVCVGRERGGGIRDEYLNKPFLPVGLFHWFFRSKF